MQRNVLYNVGAGLDSPYYIHLSGSLRTTKQTQEQRHQPKTYLTTESVDGASLTLESVYDVEGCDGLSLGVFGVGDGIADNTFKEDFEDTSGLFVDETGDTFDTTTTSETADSGFRDSLCSAVRTGSKTRTYGCCLAESCDDVWHHPFQDPCLLYRVQTLLMSELKRDERLKTSE